MRGVLSISANRLKITTQLLILHVDRIIQDPYPLTHFCEVPVEDKTNYPLCRVLPVEHFPRLLASTPEIQLQTQAHRPPGTLQSRTC